MESMVSMVPPPLASASGEGQGGTQIQDPPLCSIQQARHHAAVRQKFGNSSLREVCHHPEHHNRPCLTSWLPRCQHLPSINLPLAQPRPQAKRWGADAWRWSRLRFLLSRFMALLVRRSLAGAPRTEQGSAQGGDLARLSSLGHVEG